MNSNTQAEQFLLDHASAAWKIERFEAKVETMKLNDDPTFLEHETALKVMQALYTKACEYANDIRSLMLEKK